MKPTVRTAPQPRRGRLHGALIAVVAGLAMTLLAACNDRTSSADANRQVDAALDKTEKAAAVAADKAGALADTARDKTRAYLTSPEVKQDVESAKQALHNATEPQKNP